MNISDQIKTNFFVEIAKEKVESKYILIAFVISLFSLIPSMYVFDVPISVLIACLVFIVMILCFFPSNIAQQTKKLVHKMEEERYDGSHYFRKKIVSEIASLRFNERVCQERIQYHSERLDIENKSLEEITKKRKELEDILDE